jgi:hypothetical protein
LRYDDADLLSIFGGRVVAIESPLIQEIVTEAVTEDRAKLIVRFLTGRFGDVPADLAAAVHAIKDKDRLEQLAAWAGACPDLEAFRARLSS